MFEIVWNCVECSIKLLVGFVDIEDVDDLEDIEDLGEFEIDRDVAGVA